MKCLMCESFSLTHICSSCQNLHLQAKIYKRKLSNGIAVISFYKYQEIKELLHTKHTDLGFYIYKILAKNSLSLFAKDFEFPHTLHSLAIDDAPQSGYSHTAVLNKCLKSQCIQPIHAKLRAINSVSYSGKSKLYREQNPRDFRVSSFEAKEIVLVDDIITTGSTLIQAIDALQKENKEVLFCLTLTDVSNKEATT